MAWSQENPEAPESAIPKRSQVGRKKAQERARHVEDSIANVQALISQLRQRDRSKDWQLEVLGEDMEQGLLCFSSGFYVRIYQKIKEKIAEHGFRLACDATHDISISKVKLFVLGWLAQHVESHHIRNTFVPLAFAMAPSESSLVTKFLLEGTESFLNDRCGDTLKNAKVARMPKLPIWMAEPIW